MKCYFFSPLQSLQFKTQRRITNRQKAALLRYIKDALASLHFIYLNKPLWHRDTIKAKLMALTVHKHLVCCKQMDIEAAHPLCKDLSSEQHTLKHGTCFRCVVLQKKSKNKKGLFRYLSMISF